MRSNYVTETSDEVKIYFIFEIWRLKGLRGKPKKANSQSMEGNNNNNNNNNNSNNNNSILYYLCAEPTATRPITGTEQCR
jgi:hypothetical protein